MYACIFDVGCGSFGGVCTSNDRPLISSDPPPHQSRIDYRKCQSLEGWTGQRMYSLPHSFDQARVQVSGHKPVYVVVVVVVYAVDVVR
jgi:hypothetical protein